MARAERNPERRSPAPILEQGCRNESVWLRRRRQSAPSPIGRGCHGSEKSPYVQLHRSYLLPTRLAQLAGSSMVAHECRPVSVARRVPLDQSGGVLT